MFMKKAHPGFKIDIRDRIEHRSMTPAPYWDIPLANQVVPRLRKFNSDLRLLNDVLDSLISRGELADTNLIKNDAPWMPTFFYMPFFLLQI